MAHDATKRLTSDVALSDMPVPIDTRVERDLGIVEMDQAQVRQSHHPLKRREHLLNALRGMNRVTSRKHMRGVQTDAHTTIRLHRVSDGGELFKLIA